MRRHRLGFVAPAGQIAVEQGQQAGHTDLGQGAVADIFAREGVLVHLGAHIAWIDPIDAP